MQWEIDSSIPVDNSLKDSILDRIEEGTFSMDDLPDFFAVFTQLCNNTEDIQDETEGFNKRFQYKIDGKPYAWMKVKNQKFSMGSGEISSPDITLDMSSKLAVGIFSGAIDPTAAYMNGELKVDGIINDALTFRTILDIVQEELEG
jgi:putative sterol carrier protein